MIDVVDWLIDVKNKMVGEGFGDVLCILVDVVIGIENDWCLWILGGMGS